MKPPQRPPNARSAVRPSLARLLAGAILCLAVLPLAAWSNGPDRGDGVGTHDWVLFQADRLARAEGHGWLDWPVAQRVTDDPDMVLHDYRHHVYDVWGSPYGDAPARVAGLYREAVERLRSHDVTGASVSFGLLSHYYADVCDPLHTDQTPDEDRVHGAYETAVQRMTDDVHENADWVTSDGIETTADAESMTKEAASFAHASYRTLVEGFGAERMSPAVVAVTRSSVNRASNDLADLLASVAAEAGRSSADAGDAIASGADTPVAGIAASAAAVPEDGETPSAGAGTEPTRTLRSPSPVPPARRGLIASPFLLLACAGCAAVAVALAAWTVRLRGRRR